MAEKVLLLRCASMPVIEMVVNKINPAAEITCLVQDTFVQQMSEKFKNWNVVSIGASYFSYESFCKNVSFAGKFDVVYVPSSAVEFHGFEEVFRIVEKIHYKKLVLINCKGEETVEYHNFLETVKENIYNFLSKGYLAIFTSWYKHIGQKMKI